MICGGIDIAAACKHSFDNLGHLSLLVERKAYSKQGE